MKTVGEENLQLREKLLKYEKLVGSDKNGEKIKKLLDYKLSEIQKSNSIVKKLTEDYESIHNLCDAHSLSIQSTLDPKFVEARQIAINNLVAKNSFRDVGGNSFANSSSGDPIKKDEVTPKIGKKNFKNKKHIEETYFKNDFYVPGGMNSGQDTVGLIQPVLSYTTYLYGKALYLSMYGLDTLVDFPINLALKKPFVIRSENRALERYLIKRFKELKIVDVARDMLTKSLLTVRGSLVVPIIDESNPKEKKISYINVLDDTSFYYSISKDYYNPFSQGYTAIKDFYVLDRRLTDKQCYFCCDGFDRHYQRGKDYLSKGKDIVKGIALFAWTTTTIAYQASLRVVSFLPEVFGEGASPKAVAHIQDLLSNLESTPSGKTVFVPYGTEIKFNEPKYAKDYSKIPDIYYEMLTFYYSITKIFFKGSDQGSSLGNGAAESEVNVRVTLDHVKSKFQEGMIKPFLHWMCEAIIRTELSTETAENTFDVLKEYEGEFEISFASIYEHTEFEDSEAKDKKLEAIEKLISVLEYGGRFPFILRKLSELDFLTQEDTDALDDYFKTSGVDSGVGKNLTKEERVGYEPEGGKDVEEKSEDDKKRVKAEKKESNVLSSGSVLEIEGLGTLSDPIKEAEAKRNTDMSRGT